MLELVSGLDPAREVSGLDPAREVSGLDSARQPFNCVSIASNKTHPSIVVVAPFDRRGDAVVVSWNQQGPEGPPGADGVGGYEGRGVGHGMSARRRDRLKSSTPTNRVR